MTNTFIKACALSLTLLFNTFSALHAENYAVKNFAQLTAGKSPELVIEQLVQSSSHKPLILKFFMVGCPPCQRMKPVFNQVAQTLGEQVQCIEIDIDAFTSIAEKYGVQSVPSFVFYAKGKEQGQRIIGPTTATVLKAKAKQYFQLP